MIDQFEQHRAVERNEGAQLIEAFGKNWVIAKRTPRIIERYGEDVKCISPKQMAQERAKIHERGGCPPGCPARKEVAS